MTVSFVLLIMVGEVAGKGSLPREAAGFRLRRQ